MGQQRYKKVLGWLLCLSLFCAGCYPYNTPQAKAARRQAKAAKAQARRQSPPPDSLGTGQKWAKIPSDTNKIDSLSPPPDSLGTSQKWGKGPAKPDSLGLAKDSLGQKIDSLGQNNAPQDSLKSPKIVRFSPDSLSVPVIYEAKDSMIFDIPKRKLYLYGQAEVAYEQYLLKAAYIEVDFNTYLATAYGLPDSLGRIRGQPEFTDGEQTFEAKKIQYNFKSKKGKVYEASTRQGDGFFVSDATKFISKDPSDSSSRDVIYSDNCLYTTCNHTEPHFGIRSSKAKVIPGKLIIVGPSYLEIMGTPTPLVLPFGFFPLNNDKRKNGLIFSTNVEFSQILGPGIRGMGYYVQFSPKADFTLLTDLYLRGSARATGTLRYNERYKANGALAMSFANLLFDQRGFMPDSTRINRGFNLNWTHQQDQKAHPSQTFSASVQIGSSDFFRLNSNDASQILQSAFNSNISYTKRFIGTPFTMTVAANHTQNTQTRQMTLNLPRLDLRMNQIFPFKRKNPIGKERWYERMSFAYNMAARNTINTTDTALFKAGALRRILDTMEYDIRHNPSINLSVKLLKYINMQPSIQYGETWYFYSRDRSFDPRVEIRQDTLFGPDGTTVLSVRTDTSFGQVSQARNYGFHSVRDLGAGVNFNTQMFATGIYNLGRFHALWARIEPNLGFRWRPDYGSDFWGYYGKVQTDVRYPDSLQTYARFPSVPAPGLQANLTYGLSMRMEAKWRKSKRDTTAKEEPFQKWVILNNFLVNGSYNMAADSFQWSTVSLNASTTLFKLVNLTFNSIFDPYQADPFTNQRLQTLQWDDNRRLVRLTSGNLAASTSFSSKVLRERFGRAGASSEAKPTGEKPKLEFFEGFNLNYNLVFQKRFVEGRDSLLFTSHEISLTGLINLSENWNIRIARVGYDLANRRLTFPDFSFARDLHCWELGMSWQPDPLRRSWSFFIRVKPSSLGFLNVPVRKNFFDPF